jgi:hypothetical protein
MTKYPAVKCPQCKELVPGNEYSKHRREIHNFKKILVKNELNTKDKTSCVAKESVPENVEPEKKVNVWGKMIFSGFESNRKKH